MMSNSSGHSIDAISVDELTLRPLEEWYGSVVDVPIGMVNPDPDNLRQHFDVDDIADLGRNMLSIGQLDEITVFPILNEGASWNGYFDLHDGERRWRAAHAVGLPTLRAKVVSRPDNEVLLFKKVSRVLQTRSLAPETKVAGLERVLDELGILDQPDSWESYRQQLGGGPEWPQLVRVLLLKPRVRQFLEQGSINFTIAQAIGRLPTDRQEDAAEFAIVHKINGRFLSTQMVPYLLENPDANMAQAFEQARVGGWKNAIKSPYQKGQGPTIDERIETFLGECVKWERAWETIVYVGGVHQVAGNAEYEFRMKDAARRIAERAGALVQQIAQGQTLDEPINLGDGKIIDVE